MAENKQNTTPARRPDCVTEIRMGNTVLVVSGFFKKDTTDTAADKMMKVLEAEAVAGHKAQLSPYATSRTEKSSFYRAVKKQKPLYRQPPHVV